MRRLHRWTTRARLRTAAFMLVSLALIAPGTAAAIPPPGEDPFYEYTGTKPLEQVSPGTVLNTRTVSYHIAGYPLPLKVTQVAYRSTGARGQATVNATTIMRPFTQRLPGRRPAPKLIAYASFYDSLNPADQPSTAIAGGKSLGAIIPGFETALLVPFLQRGYTITIPDTEGQDADFAAGPEYGMATLDGIRATFNSPAGGLREDTKVGIVGYSGGAIATEWAAELAPKYAPDVDDNLVGAAMGGVLVNPARNLHYVSGSQVWAGVMPMAIIGIARAYDIDLKQYMSPRGEQLYERMQDATITDALGRYPGLTWRDLAKPEYGTPEDVPIYAETVNKLIMGTGGTPTIPLFIGQGAHGEIEGTPGDKPGIGKGDGVMIAGDVRALAHQYCDAGVTVEYRQYESASHVTAATLWLSSAYSWMNSRFYGTPAPDNCGTYPPGNSLAPIPEPDAPAPAPAALAAPADAAAPQAAAVTDTVPEPGADAPEPAAAPEPAPTTAPQPATQQGRWARALRRLFR